MAEHIHNTLGGAAQWSAEWPTEPGWYWFYGRSGFDIRRQSAPHLLLTYADGRQIHYLHEGMHFCFEGGKGVWMPIQEPSLP